ncbi:MAG: plasmid maintenance system killer family protein [Alphaproteobacteria bacterium]|nr:plasmid maintenance system killer family protein [Alphaproteobacteria bacterium]
MNRSFGDAKIEAIFYGECPKGAPEDLFKRARKVLGRIHTAHDVTDLKVPPSYRLHKLDGDLKGFWSVSVNMQWRIIFKFEGNDAEEVQFLDYH